MKRKKNVLNLKQIVLFVILVLIYTNIMLILQLCIYSFTSGIFHSYTTLISVFSPGVQNLECVCFANCFIIWQLMG